MQQSRPWARPTPVPCVRCGGVASRLVYLPELREDGTLQGGKAAFADALPTTTALACEGHCEQMMVDLIPLVNPLYGVAAAPLRATLRGWFYDSTWIGRRVWRFQLWRWARLVKDM